MDVCVYCVPETESMAEWNAYYQNEEEDEEEQEEGEESRGRSSQPLIYTPQCLVLVLISPLNQFSPGTHTYLHTYILLYSSTKLFSAYHLGQSHGLLLLLCI